MDAYDTATTAVTEQFRAGLESEYGSDGRQWLAELPQLLESLCTRWELELTARPRSMATCPSCGGSRAAQRRLL